MDTLDDRFAVYLRYEREEIGDVEAAERLVCANRVGQFEEDRERAHCEDERCYRKHTQESGDGQRAGQPGAKQRPVRRSPDKSGAAEPTPGVRREPPTGWRAGDDEAPENRYSDQRNADNSQRGQRVPSDDIGQ